MAVEAALANPSVSISQFLPELPTVPILLLQLLPKLPTESKPASSGSTSCASNLKN